MEIPNLILVMTQLKILAVYRDRYRAWLNDPGGVLKPDPEMMGLRGGALLMANRIRAEETANMRRRNTAVLLETLKLVDTPTPFGTLPTP